jgi:hypothetical protein
MGTEKQKPFEEFAMRTDDSAKKLPVLFSQLEIDLLKSQACDHRQNLGEFLRAKLGLPHQETSKSHYEANCSDAPSVDPHLGLGRPA